MAFGPVGILLVFILVFCAWAGNWVTGKSAAAGWMIPFVLLGVILLPLVGLTSDAPDSRGAAMMLSGMMLGFLGPAVIGGIIGAAIATFRKSWKPAGVSAAPTRTSN